MLTFDGKPFHILIVDDIPDNIKLVATILAQEDSYHLSFATDGARALQLVAAQPPDLILLDVMMPGLNGYQVCAQLKRDPELRAIPVIFLTAKADSQSIVQGFAAGGSDYLAKPFHSAELHARISHQLRLREAEKQLKSMNAAKDKFLSIVSHDLRGPMASLRDMLAMLRKTHLNLSPDELAEWLRIAAEQSEQFYTLLEGLLSWARLQGGVLEYHPEPLDLYLLSHETQFLYEVMAKEKNIQFINEIAKETWVFADRNMANTILRNLLSNALKFTRPNGWVKLRADRNHGMIAVSVLDNGIGIAPQDLPKLFRLDESFKRPGTAGEPGSGMGLILVKDLVEKNGGAIWAESLPGHGVTMTFSLKAAAAT